MTIDEIIARMGWAAAPDLAVTPLGGGITNLNYRVEARGQVCAVRIPGRDSAYLGIDRAREHACSVAAHRSGVAPAIVEFLEQDGILITEFISGRGATAEEMQRPGMVRRVAETLRRFHGGPPFPGTFSPFRTVREYHAVAAAHGAPLPGGCDWMLAQADLLETALGRPDVLRPCHNDLLAGNFLDDGERLWILDWEYAAMGDAFFDLGNFAVHHQLSDSLEQTFLDAYAGPATEAAVARLKLMKIVSDLREAMWAMVQVAVSGIDYDFRAYGQKHFDRYAAQLADPSLPHWLDGVAADGIA